MKKLLYLLAITLLFSCKTDNYENIENVIDIACIGDSITYGKGIEDRINNNYPAILSRMLGPNFKVVNFGVNGTTLLKKGNKPYWKTKAFNSAINYNPDIVIIKLGSNDSKKKNWKYKEDFILDYIDLINTFNSLESNPQIYVCLPAPAFPGNFGIYDEVIQSDIIPKINKLAIKSNNLTVIDLYTPLKNYKEFFPDKVHPNRDGAEIIANEIYKKITNQ